MPKLKPTKNLGNPLSVAEIRILRALESKSGSLKWIAQWAGKSGAVSGNDCHTLAARGLIESEDVMLDGGGSERIWHITDSGRAAITNGATLPDLKSTRQRSEEIKIGALVPLFGSNRMLASEVGKALEGCEWVGVPFMGSLAEVPHIKARTVMANDRHELLVNLAMVAADPSLGVALWKVLKRMAFHPKTLELSQRECRSWEQARQSVAWNGIPNLEIAINYYVCAWMARNGEAGKEKELTAGMSLRWNAGGGDSCVRFRNAATSIRDWRRVLHRCSFTCMDAFDFLAKCKDQKKHGVYCDPPFPGPGDAYKHKFSEAEQLRLANALTQYKEARVVCRFYDVPLVRKLYTEASGWKWLRFAGRKQTNDEAPEVLIVRN